MPTLRLSLAIIIALAIGTPAYCYSSKQNPGSVVSMSIEPETDRPSSHKKPEPARSDRVDGESLPSWRLYPFQNTSLPWDERVDDLVSRLSLHELMVQMSRGGAGAFATPDPGIPRLGFGPYVFNSNCHRGMQDAPGNATAFPQSIGIAATFSHQVLFDVGTVASIETRGKHNDFVRDGIFATHTGASCYSPVINVVRDSRWGRIQETYGECPYMSGEMAAKFLYGLHGSHNRFVRVTGGCLHLDAYSGPEDIPVSRFSFNAKVTEEDLHMTYLPGFKRCVTAGTYSFMCSYNRVNGVPACANKMLMTDTLRKAWKFKGYVVSDQGAIEYIITKHKWLHSKVDTAAACVNAGCNMELSNNLYEPIFMYIEEAVRQGKINESLVRDMVKPLFYTRMRLGHFDPANTNPYTKLNKSVVETPEHQAKALEVSMKSFVLLKNTNSFLPIDKTNFKKVAMIGPMSNNYGEIFGNHPPRQSRFYTKTPLEGLKDLFPDIHHKEVCEKGTACPSYSSGRVKELSLDKDLIFVALGTGPSIEEEFRDRRNLELPGKQRQLLEEIIEKKGDAKLVLLLLNAGPVNVTFADESEHVLAILECFFPGQGTGEAIKNVLINKNGNSSPAGRLPLTYPKFHSQLPPMVDYSMANRTYRYLETPPLYPFGYGLSYTTFHYSTLQAKPKVGPREDQRVSISVKNTGNLPSDEVIQCYISWGDRSLPVPLRQLSYFDRVHIDAGETSTFTFDISAERYAFWRDGYWNVKAGIMFLSCGGQQPDQVKTAPSNVLTLRFSITADAQFDDSVEDSALL